MVEILKDFISKKIELLKMNATEKSVMALSFFVFSAFLLLALLVFILLLNIGLGLLIGNYLGNYGYGMLIIAGFYFLFVFVILLCKKSIKKSVANFFLKHINS